MSLIHFRIIYSNKKENKDKNDKQTKNKVVLCVIFWDSFSSFELLKLKLFQSNI